LTQEFEKRWSRWLGVKYSVFVNSGSSANMLMYYALKISGRLKNNKIIAPCVCWPTTITPGMQFNYEIILCDCDNQTLGLDINHFEQLCKEHAPACAILVHVLGFSNNMHEILRICKQYNVILLEDSCESVGTLYSNKKTGTFGTLSSFSTYFGHHFSTIEGGFISTDDFELYEILKALRSHGWSRDLSVDTQINLQQKYNIKDFENLYTFYYPGFNVRPTDLQAYLGLNQLKTLDIKNQKRYYNLLYYNNNITNSFWKIKFTDFVSNFAYPVIHPRKKEIVETLKTKSVETRPLIVGNIAKQPFYKDIYKTNSHYFADVVHEYGFYLPNNPDMTEEELDYICNIVNFFTK
jgi:CDP-6-deoxy-D-xylo-4-hexulose-3-dehydrase